TVAAIPSEFLLSAYQNDGLTRMAGGPRLPACRATRLPHQCMRLRLPGKRVDGEDAPLARRFSSHDPGHHLHRGQIAGDLDRCCGGGDGNWDRLIPAQLPQSHVTVSRTVGAEPPGQALPASRLPGPEQRPDPELAADRPGQ